MTSALASPVYRSKFIVKPSSVVLTSPSWSSVRRPLAAHLFTLYSSSSSIRHYHRHHHHRHHHHHHTRLFPKVMTFCYIIYCFFSLQLQLVFSVWLRFSVLRDISRNTVVIANNKRCQLQCLGCRLKQIVTDRQTDGRTENVRENMCVCVRRRDRPGQVDITAQFVSKQRVVRRSHRAARWR